jgi:hypothetical protein
MLPIQNRFLRHIELWLSGAGLLVVWAASAILAPGEADFWQVAALTALAVSVLHGAIFRLVRHRQRRVLEQAIVELREMLGDVIKNQLAVIGMWLPDAHDQTLYEEQMDGIQESLSHIEGLIDTVSEESIQTWKSKYKEALENTGAFPTA